MCVELDLFINRSIPDLRCAGIEGLILVEFEGPGFCVCGTRPVYRQKYPRP